MTDRHRRLAENEVAFREVNERVSAQVEDIAGSHATFNVLCECSDSTCAARITVTPAEYGAIHAEATHFIVIRGHADPSIEDIVDATELYEIVRKRGEAADIARESDES